MWNVLGNSGRDSPGRAICRVNIESSIGRWEMSGANVSPSGRNNQKTSGIQKLDRRNFLKTSAAATGGLVLGFYLPDDSFLQAQNSPGKLNAYVQVGTDDTVTLYIHKAEMGQGTVTSLSMLLAEELECDWAKIRTEFPGVDP